MQGKKGERGEEGLEVGWGKEKTEWTRGKAAHL